LPGASAFAGRRPFVDGRIIVGKGEFARLMAAARAARERAYAPYSDFKVGAAALGDDGRVYVGVNVENASYGLSLCAERAAVAAAVAGGAREIIALAIAADRPAAPCGACRQVIVELGPEATVIWEDGAGGYVVKKADELLPERFRLDESRGR
jgi:cytidine deaminase